MKNPAASKAFSAKEAARGERRKFVDIPCGKCFGCMRMRCESWVFRHLIQLRHSESAMFVTLTYDTEHLPLTSSGTPCFDKRHCQLFFKSVRNYLAKHYPDVKIKYHLASEYGDTFGRPHYHLLLYNFPNDDVAKINLAKSWKYGAIDIGQVTEASIRYVVEYITQYYFNWDWDDVNCVPFALYSKRPAIGDYEYKEVADYIRANKKKLYVIDGKFFRIPSSYYQKLIDKGYITYHFDLLLSQLAQNYYYEQKQNSNAVAISRGIDPYANEMGYIAQKQRQQREKFLIRKPEAYG